MLQDAIRDYGEKKLPVALLALPVIDAIAAVAEVLAPSPANEGEDRALANLQSYLDPPRTLQELQSGPPPGRSRLGYDGHHLVGQFKSNIEKAEKIVIEKFGREMIEDPSNIVWIPRLKHRDITDADSRRTAADPSMTRRKWVGQFDWDRQREENLKSLIESGVLK